MHDQCWKCSYSTINLCQCTCTNNCCMFILIIFLCLLSQTEPYLWTEEEGKEEEVWDGGAREHQGSKGGHLDAQSLPPDRLPVPSNQRSGTGGHECNETQRQPFHIQEVPHIRVRLIDNQPSHVGDYIIITEHFGYRLCSSTCRAKTCFVSN